VLDLQRITHLTFDCYGTLIDWETGILQALNPILARHGVTTTDEELLRLFVKLEAEEEIGHYKSYRDVLSSVMACIGTALHFKPSPGELARLADSMKDWRPFPDTIAALRILKRRFQIAIISNVDDALFASTARRLQVSWNSVTTAQLARSYKPARRNFRCALMRLGIQPADVLHVAQSLYHDHVPAQALGISTVWVKRPSRLGVTGLALPVDIRPNLEVPDLQTLADIAVSGARHPRKNSSKRSAVGQ
jgi:2-haloacid dehalogenase